MRELDTRSLESLILLSARYKVILWKIPNNLINKSKWTLSFVLLAVMLVCMLFGGVARGWRQENSQTPANNNSTQLLVKAAKGLESSLPFRCKSRMRVKLFNSDVVAQGAYMQMGQGSGVAKLEFQYGPLDDLRTILQICHRGYYYRFRSESREPRLEIVDLRQIADSDSQQIVANPNTWMATGGLASLLKNLANYFNFDAVNKTTLGEIPVWQIRGRWDEKRLKRLLFGQVRFDVIENQINWSQIPGHVPDSCEILLARDSFFPLFPYRITFYRTIETNDKLESRKIVELELYELEKNVLLEEGMFFVDFKNIAPSYLTEQYVQRIENLKKVQRSASQFIQNNSRK